MKKSIITARLTDGERQTIERTESTLRKKISPYLIYAATCENIGLKPITLIRLERIKALLNDISGYIPPDKKSDFESEVYELWQSINL